MVPCGHDERPTQLPHRQPFPSDKVDPAMPPERKLKAVPPPAKTSTTVKPEDLAQVTTRKGPVQLLRSKRVDVKRAARALQDERELRQLQVELVKLQRNVQINGRRVAIVFEGRDAAEKVGPFVDSSNT